MRWLFQRYKGFSVREKRAFLVMLIIIVALLVIRIIQSSIKPDPLVLSEKQKQEIESFIHSFEKKPQPNQEKPTLSTAKIPSPPQYNFLIFDPNKVKRKELIDMGLSSFVVNNIVAYRKAGGKFDNPADLTRIYGLEEEVYKQMLPYIRINDTDSLELKTPVDKKYVKSEHTEMPKIAINKASFSELMKIPELTPRLAGRILNYRDLLGGYYSMDQLGEVYDLEDSLRIILQDYLVVDPENIIKISLQEVDFGDLLSHPYLEKEHVKKFFALRDYYGDSLALKHVRINRIFPDSVYDLIEPYFLP